MHLMRRNSVHAREYTLHATLMDRQPSTKTTLLYQGDEDMIHQRRQHEAHLPEVFVQLAIGVLEDWSQRDHIRRPSHIQEA